MKNCDFVVAQHLLPIMTDCIRQKKCRCEVLDDFRKIIKKQKIMDDFKVLKKNVNDTCVAYIFSFKDTRNVDDIIFSAVVINTFNSDARYFILRHSIEYDINADSGHFDFGLKGGYYEIAEIRESNIIKMNFTLANADKTYFIQKIIKIAKAF